MASDANRTMLIRNYCRCVRVSRVFYRPVASVKELSPGNIKYHQAEGEEMKKFLLAIIALLIAGCATTGTKTALIDSMAEKAGIVCYTYLPTHRVEINAFCALSAVLAPDSDPVQAQEYLKANIARLWVAGGDTGAWIVATTLNDFVRFTGLQGAANKDSLKTWIDATKSFCGGVTIAAGK